MNKFLENFNFKELIGCGNIDVPNSACPDQIVGKLVNGVFKQCNRENVDYLGSMKCPKIKNQLQNPIVIILESPHKNEYQGLTPKGPALGKTFEYFELYFDRLIRSSGLYSKIRSKTCDVVFMNAVPYQCSEGKPLNKANRLKCNQNWEKCFVNGCSDYLISRIVGVNPIVVINLCTSPSFLRPMVERKIINMSIAHTLGNHPSSWWSPKNRVIK